MMDKPMVSTGHSESAAQSTCAFLVKSRELLRANQLLLKCQHDRKEFPEYVFVKVVTL